MESKIHEVVDHNSERQLRLPGDQRKRLLLKHALWHFSQKGFHATSMQEIATSAGITKPVIYQHFASKRALYLELLNLVGIELCNVIRDATTGAKTVHERVSRGYMSYFQFAHDNRAGYELLFGSGQRRDVEFQMELSKIENEISDLVTSQIDADISEAHRRFLALGVISLAEGTVRRWLREIETSDPSTTSFIDTNGPMWATRVAELAWAGLRGIQREPGNDS